jgi:hypothetical protein
MCLACPFDGPSIATVNIKGTSCRLTVGRALWLALTRIRFETLSKENHSCFASTCIALTKL